MGREEGVSGNKRKLILPLVLDLVSWGHDADVNHAGKIHEMSSLISSVMTNPRLGTLPLFLRIGSMYEVQTELSPTTKLQTAPLDIMYYVFPCLCTPTFLVQSFIN